MDLSIITPGSKQYDEVLKIEDHSHYQVQNNNQIVPTKFAKISYYKNPVLKKIPQSFFNQKLKMFLLCCKQMD
jgi:phage regulator Rha-like protein